MKKLLKTAKFLVILLGFLLVGPAINFFFRSKASNPYLPRHIKNLALLGDQAMIEIYGAGAGRWQACFSLHTWIALKKRDEKIFTIYEVRRDHPPQGLPAVDSWKGNPDRTWSDNPPEQLLHLEGEQAENLIPLIEEEITKYPYQNSYTVWPGPNCNTFIAYIGRKFPELGLVLPPQAIGKDFLTPGEFFAVAPSGTGYQFSFYGMLGITLAFQEGLEFDFLGLNFGFSPNTTSLLLPGIGKIQLLSSQ